MAFIYKISFKTTPKVYIGQTGRTIEIRFAEHVYDAFHGSELLIHRAIRKYGIENCHLDLVEETDEPLEREKFWIAFYDSFNNGYNMTIGGEGTVQYGFDPEEIVTAYSTYGTVESAAKSLNVPPSIISKYLKAAGFETNGNKEGVRLLDLDGTEIRTFDKCIDAAKYVIEKQGLTSSPDNVVITINKVCNGKQPSAYGYKFEHMNNGDKKVCVYREILQFDLHMNFIAKYNTASEAARAVGATYRSIQSACEGITKTCKGFIWMYGQEIKPSWSRQVLQQDPVSGEIIKTWPSVSDVAKAFGVNEITIRRVCQGKRKTSCNYIWKYAS